MTEINRCCGTCRFWIVDPDRDFAEKLKQRFKSDDPRCRHDKKIRTKNEGSGCLGWKGADPWDLEKRGYSLD
jgi:hypothetical protein